MYLIAGLGNPGKQYEATRHNMGFDTIDCLVEKHNIPQGGVKFNAMYGKSIIGGEKAILMKPLSYMNLSGGPIQEMSSYFKIDPETELIVIWIKRYPLVSNPCITGAMTVIIFSLKYP